MFVWSILHFSPITAGFGMMVLVLTGLMSFVYIQYKLVKLHNEEDNPISDSNGRLYYFGLSAGIVTSILLMIGIITKKMMPPDNIPDISVEYSFLIPTLIFVPYFVAGILIPVITISYTPRMKSFVINKLTLTLRSSLELIHPRILPRVTN